MTALGAAIRGRYATERYLLLDTAEVSRGGAGAPVFDPDTGDYSSPAATVVHTGPCRVRSATQSEVEALFGERQVTISKYVIVFGVDTPQFEMDDTIRVIVATLDEHLPERRFRVVAVPSATTLMYRAVGVEVVDE